MAARRRQAARLSPEKGARVLVAAQRVFLREGYRVSMDRIAAEAGVANQAVGIGGCVLADRDGVEPKEEYQKFGKF